MRSFLPTFMFATAISTMLQIHFSTNDLFATYISVPSHSSRQDTPWRLPHRLELSTLKASRNRILYSSLQRQAGAGLGHYFRSVSAEVSTAMRLKLTYVHREALHGALSSTRVNNLFNLGKGYTRREDVYADVCTNNTTVNGSWCNDCHGIKKANWHGIRKVVHLSRQLTYDWSADDEFSDSGKEKVAEFLKIDGNDDEFSLLHMPTGDCDRHVAAKFIGPNSLSYFFHRFWDAHGSDTHLERYFLEEQLISTKKERKTKNLLRDDELNIALHARRGDFFECGRPRVCLTAYGKVIRNIMSIVQSTGGIYAKLKVKVRLYSEGLPVLNTTSTGLGHDMREHSHRFQDADGAVLSEQVIYETLFDVSVFRHGFELEMRISSDTLDSIHEMAMADIFIGSESTMGSVVVQSLSRGALILLPVRKGRLDDEAFAWRYPLRSFFDDDSGELLESRYLRKLWIKYVRFTHRSVEYGVT